MTDYCDNRVPGGTFFFTVRLLERGSTLLTDQFAAFGEAMRLARVRKPFHVDAWAVLPDHAHAMWTLPPGDHDCASRWRAVKIAFSKALRKACVPDANDGAIWERHYQHYRVGDDDEYAALIDYTHTNPVRHGHCLAPGDWPWSSLHRFLNAGYAMPGPGLIVPPWVHRPQSQGFARL
ncbi:REP-associated tyrosine transposase [Massilia sp. BKSP1R2A-1]|jgi:putative transposase|uniref:REP-associated tyrosine transposase n=1 Tax=Massilia sp. BKSP1R2A-1 TaxID=3422595 RepID=UPI003D3381CD